MKKKFVVIAAILILLVYIIFNMISYAENSTLFIGINATHKNGVGYGIGDPNNVGVQIWNLRNYNSNNRDDESAIQREIYCLKEQYGYSWETNEDNIVEYNLTYDLQKDRAKLLQLLGNSVTDTPNSVVAKILDANNGYYRELLWVLDNAYISGKSDMNKLLEKIGILYDSNYDVYYYQPVEGYDYSDKLAELEYNYTLTETDIKAVQQAVIWYFMNAKLDNNSNLDKKDTTSWLTITTDGNSYTYLEDMYKFQSTEGTDRADQANILYNYLIDSAIKNASSYTEENGYEIESPTEFDTTGLTMDTDGSYKIQMTRSGNNYIVGPIKINKNNELDYDIELKLKNQNNEEISSTNYKFTNASGTSLGTSNIKDLVGNADGFYITFSRQVAKEITIEINVSYTTNSKQLWLQGTENGTTSITVNEEQPAVDVDIDEEPHNQSITLKAKANEFDLALRKYITAINDTSVQDTRVPNISLNTLDTDTTATYNHRKDPVLVKHGDIVTYKITIYNEGTNNGYATEITDQLPTGLKYVGGNTLTSDKNTYNVTYDEENNIITFTSTTSNALNKYQNNTLDSETLEFNCEVTATADTDNDTILTNVAWISGAYDSELGKTITNVGDDIDSRPQTSPSVDKDSMENYKGNSTNKTDLADSNNFYKGEQDDDDFEKLKIEPETTVTVTKTWNDNQNQDGIRPPSIIVNLLADGVEVQGKTATLSESNNWTYTFDKLPLKSNGKEIMYSVTEHSDVEGYSTEINGFTITNTHEPATMQIPVEKKWEDANNQDGKRPTSITVDLYADDVKVDGKTLTLNQSNEWKGSFTDLPVYANGAKINYTIKETGVPEGYTPTQSGDMTSGFILTNTYIPETTEVTVNKEWVDNNDQDGLRPETVTIELLADGDLVEEVTLDEENYHWTHTFTNLPKYRNGTEIQYTVREKEVPPGYIDSQRTNGTNDYTIINTHTTETVQVTVNKEWVDNNDQDGIRPETVTIELLANGEFLQEVTLDEENYHWTHTFENLPKYKGGAEIQYTVREKTIPDGYIAEKPILNSTNNYTIKNTHTPETIEVIVNKEWVDNNDQDGVRTETVIIELLADGSPIQEVTLDEENYQWTHTFENLPKYKDGIEIKYTVREKKVPTGYEESQRINGTNNFTIINTHTSETIEVSVEKRWNDRNDEDKIRPEKVSIRLLANGAEQKTIELPVNGEWKYTFTDLPKYANGTEIQYTVEEINVPEGYTPTIEGDMTNGYVITNTHKIFDLALRKYITEINGNNVTDTRVPNIIENTLQTGTTATYNHRKDPVTVSENDTVTYRIAIYNEGEKSGYASQIIDQLPTGLIYVPNSTVTSIDAKGAAKNTYTVTYEPTSNKITFDIVNTEENVAKDLQPYEVGNLDVEIIEIECKVVAKANTTNNQILTNVAWISGAYDTEDNQIANDRDSQPEESPDVNKDNMEDYKGNPNNKEDLTDDEYYYEGEQDDDDFEKLVIEPKINITVTKRWEDFNNQDNKRPTEIKVQLFADGQPVSGKEATLNESNKWTDTFTDLPKYKNETEIQYTVNEITSIPGYTPETTGNMETGYIITNTYTPEVVNIPVTKVWNDNENQDGIRPTEIKVQLLAYGQPVSGKEVTLNEANKWTYTFRNLPKNQNGNEIEYTVQEITSIPEYIPEITGNMETGYIMTNTHTPETTEVSVEKRWNDNNNQDGKRPASITVTLYANGEEVDGQVATLSEANGWKHTFRNLPKKEAGQVIQYTVDETGLPIGYTPETTGNMTDGFIITNTYIPETIEIPVTKVWNDNDDQDGLRPDSITVELLANGIVKDTIDLPHEGSWEYTFTNLPKYANGIEIKYTVEEESTGLPEGYTSLTTGSIATGFTITNSYTPGVTSVKVTKVWNDNNNQDGIRPPSVSVSLLANGEVMDGKTIELNEGNNWTYTFTDLPINIDGEKVEYTIVENTKIDGYTSEITNNNTTTTPGEIQTTSAPEYVITNTHETDTTQVTVNKEWADENNADRIRPDSVTVELLADGEAIDEEVLNANNNWTHTFTDLPAKVDGVDIVYTVREKEVPTGYTTGEPIENSINNYTIINTHTPEKIFDLALRKYITKINNNELETLGITSRVPNIAEDTLQSGTTATYRHKKDPIEVETNDIITYEITIYNEGEKAGYASQIIDQLPTGLIYNPSSTIISKDLTGADKNTYTVTYDTTTNKVIFDIVNTAENPAKELQPYTIGNLDYETLEIRCKVIKEAGVKESNILTNVAWISGAYDTEENKVAVDRDSEPETSPNVNKDNMENYKGNTENKEDLTDKDYYYKGEQDDDDFEKVYVKRFDLSLRKFIVEVNGEQVDREPEVDVSPLINGTGTTAIYKHPKTPVSAKVGDRVIYTIRVYNEGEIDGYANEVKDYLPPYLIYVEDSEINERYGWSISEDGRIATTSYLADKEIQAFNGTELDYEDIQIECEIASEAIPKENITNIAEISEYKYGDTVVPEDIDSESDNVEEDIPEDEDLPHYKEEEENQEYVPGNEDDDDFEKVYVKEFDLALRKFITKVQETEVTTRVPEVTYENGEIRYEHPKDALTVHVGDTIIYTLRIYNEGEISGYASEITDDIPEYLEYLPENETNVEYMWKMYDENGEETENVEEAVEIRTNYLSKENGEDNLIQAFDGNTLYYKDIQIAFKVKDPNSNETIITNHAQISDDEDENGEEITDKDSEPDEWNEGEDDQDIENVKVEYFDLALLKFVRRVIVTENGQETITETGYDGTEVPEPVVKVELHRKKLDEVTVKFVYGITIINEGDIAGYATEITDYVPEGLTFVAEDNPEWTDEGNNVISTKQLEGTLLQPGERATVEVTLTWINGEDNLALKTNTAEISQDDNEYDVPDRDSTPDNQQEGEDDIDIAKVILSIATGAVKTYFSLTLGLLGVVAIGIFAIKKFVI